MKMKRVVAGNNGIYKTFYINFQIKFHNLFIFFLY